MIFPALRASYRWLLGIVIGSSRCSFLLWFVGVIALVLVFRQSFENRSISKPRLASRTALKSDTWSLMVSEIMSLIWPEWVEMVKDNTKCTKLQTMSCKKKAWYWTSCTLSHSQLCDPLVDHVWVANFATVDSKLTRTWSRVFEENRTVLACYTPACCSTYFWKYDKGKSAPRTPMIWSLVVCWRLASPWYNVCEAVITAPVPNASI